MRRYKITIPAFSTTVEARNKNEALEQFWFDYDCAQEDPDWQKPVVVAAPYSTSIRNGRSSNEGRKRSVTNLISPIL